MKKLISLFILFLCLPASWSIADYSKTMYMDTETAGKVPFEHDLHLTRLNNNCSGCHNSIYHVVRNKNPHATMQDMAQGKSCGACHNRSYPARIQLDNCAKCHPAGESPIDIPGFGKVVFSHSGHMKLYKCSDCHGGIFRASKENPHYTMEMMEQGKGCGACHDGRTAFSVRGDCVRCHKAADTPMPAQTLFSHKGHLAKKLYSCRDCHGKFFGPGTLDSRVDMRLMEQGRSCGACHDGKTVFSVKGDCSKCHPRTRNISYKAFDANFRHDTHNNLFKCSDCHSVIYAGDSGKARHTMAQMSQGRSCGACHNGKKSFSVSGNCEKCHSGAAPDKRMTIQDIGDVTFRHATHSAKYKCGDCHNRLFTTGESAVRYTMAQMYQGKSCGECHNDKTAFGLKKGCSKCHPVRDMIFADDARFSHERHLEMYSCSDCHAKPYKAGPDNSRVTMLEMEKKGLSCAVCHNGKTGFSVAGDCSRCHKSTVNVSFYVKETGVTVFSHKSHSAYQCAGCHSGIFRAGKGRVKASMQDMEQGKSCGSCHDGKRAFGLKEGCLKCHPARNVNFAPGTAQFSHQKHIAVYACKDCHPVIYRPGANNRRYTMADMEKGKSCGVCHNGKTVFGVKGDCLKCHPGQMKSIRYELPESTGTVEFNHKTHMKNGYACGDCHYAKIPSGSAATRWAMKDMYEGKLCGACHGFSMAFSVKDPLTCERCHLKEIDWRPQPVL